MAYDMPRRRSEYFFLPDGRQVIGFERSGDPCNWWVPSEGKVLHVGTEIFRKRERLLMKKRITLMTEIAERKEQLDKVERELVGLR